MNWDSRYLLRLLRRNLGKSFLSLLLAALLAYAFGVLTVLRGIYAELYQEAEIKPAFTGGISYTKALTLADSGYLKDPYYQYVSTDAWVEMEAAEVILTNRLDHLVSAPVEWLEGWDENTALESDQLVCVMYEKWAEELGFGLGDMVRINESNVISNLTQHGADPLKEGETRLDRRDKHRPFMQLVGLIQGKLPERTVFLPPGSYRRLSFLISTFSLDLAEYTLVDYHQANEFSAYAKELISTSQNPVKFTMDTSHADRLYKIHRLIETLYPLTIAVALLLGGVLPGLTVLHASREISVLRALGAKIGKCVGIYTLAQVLCAFIGLVLGFLAVILTQHPELAAVWKPFGIYLAAHLAACAIGSSVFAWLCARKHVLAQLQAKE